MTELQDQIKELSDADFRDLKLWVIGTETTRRAQEPAVRAGQQDHYAAPGWTPENAHAMWKLSGAAPDQ